MTIARRTWETIAGCEHRFVAESIGEGIPRPNPQAICQECGATREQASRIGKYARALLRGNKAGRSAA